MVLFLSILCLCLIGINVIFLLLCICIYAKVTGKENNEAVRLIIEAIKKDPTPGFTPLRKAVCISSARKILYTCKYKFPDDTKKDTERTTQLIIALTLFLEENPEFCQKLKRDYGK